MFNTMSYIDDIYTVENNCEPGTMYVPLDRRHQDLEEARRLLEGYEDFEVWGKFEESDCDYSREHIKDETENNKHSCFMGLDARQQMDIILENLSKMIKT